MRSSVHLVSTKVLPPELVLQLERAGLTLSAHDFIKTNIQLYPQLSIQQIHQYVVLTSKTAVKAWMAIAKQFHIDPAQHFIYCTDQGTRHEALAHQLNVAGSASDATGLAAKIVKNDQVKALTHVCSQLRRDELSSHLKAKGILVEEVIGYSTEFKSIKINQPYQAVLLFSPSGVDSFLLANLIPAICFCIGTTTAAHAQEKGFKNIHIAEVATPVSLVKKVLDYYSKDAVHA